jgi:hypothetical protein
MDLSKYDNLTSQNKGILLNLIPNEINANSFRIEKHINPKQEKWILYGIEQLGGVRKLIIYSHDEISFITNYCSDILDKNFNSVLIAGLGMGILPYVLKNESKEVDVIENNQELINTIESFGYLNGVNILNQNAYNYTPIKNYDCIIIDIWTDIESTSLVQEINNCIFKYVPFLNQNGFIYFPINKVNGQTIWNYDTDIYSLTPPAIVQQHPLTTPTI